MGQVVDMSLTSRLAGVTLAGAVVLAGMPGPPAGAAAPPGAHHPSAPARAPTASAAAAGAATTGVAAAGVAASTCPPSFCVETAADMLAFDPAQVPQSQRASTVWNAPLTGFTKPRLFAAMDEFSRTVPGRDDYANAFQGSGDSGNVYNFRHWPYVGLVYYYSHSAMAVPPTGWINAAHRHGVPVLGILTGDCTGCDDEDNSFYESPAAAATLATIARTYGFDGWLFDIEGRVRLALAETVMTEMRTLPGPSGRPLIAMYYQAGVTDLEYAFARAAFRAAGFFQSDYGGGDPQVTHDVVVSNPPPDNNPFTTAYAKDLYRNGHKLDTPCTSSSTRVSNGSYCLLADQLFGDLSPIRNGPTYYQSPGLYALGWERWDGPDDNAAGTRPIVQQAMDDIFVGYGATPSGSDCRPTPAAPNAVSAFVDADGVALEPPFVTRFNTGEGDAFAVSGRAAAGAWNGLGLQDVQPTWLCPQGPGQTAAISYAQAYDGGSSLAVEGAGLVRLFATRMTPPAAARAIVRYQGAEAPALAVRDGAGRWTYATQTSSSTQDGWTTSVQDLPGTGTITEIGVRTSAGTTVIGEMGIASAADLLPAARPRLLLADAPVTGDVTWANPAGTWYANVYSCTSPQAQPLLLGRSYSGAFDPRYTLRGDGPLADRYLVQPVNGAGASSAADTCAPPDASTTGADAVTSTSARVAGQVTTESASASVRFAYGLSADLSGSSPRPAVPEAVAAHETDRAVTAELTGLEPATTYYYRVEADDDRFASATGQIRSFTTPAAPSPAPSTSQPSPSPSTDAPVPGPSPSPAPLVRQVPVRALHLPNRLHDQGWTRLFRIPVRTNAGQVARWTVTGTARSARSSASPAGDQTGGPVYTVRRHNGYAQVWLPGTARTLVRVRLSAPAVPGYTAYRRTATYRTTPTRQA